MSETKKIDFACPGCGHIFEQKKASFAGKKCECRYCKERFVAKPISTVAHIPDPVLSTSQAVILAAIITFAFSSVSGFFLGGFLNKDAAQRYRQEKTVSTKQASEISRQKQQVAEAKKQVADAKKEVAAVNAEKMRLAESLVLAEYSAWLNAHTISLGRILSFADSQFQILTFASVYSEIYNEIYNEISSLSISTQTKQHKNLTTLSYRYKEALTEMVMAALSENSTRVEKAVGLYTDTAKSAKWNTIINTFQVDQTTRDYVFACYENVRDRSELKTINTDINLVGN